MAEGKQTKRVIQNALITLTGEKDFAKISVQDIANQSGINRQTFYYHFADKAALLRWIYQTDSLCYLTSDELSLDNWEEQALKMLKAMKKKADFYQKTVEWNRDILEREFLKIVGVLFRMLFEEVDRTKELSEKDKDFYARFFSYGCSGVLTTWILNGYLETPLEMATQFFRLAKDVEFFSYQLYQQEE